jgi:hypothetical protein
MKRMNKVNLSSIVVITTLALVLGGLAIDHQAQAIVSSKDIKSKITDFLKKLKDRLTFGSGGGSECDICGPREGNG